MDKSNQARGVAIEDNVSLRADAPQVCEENERMEEALREMSRCVCRKRRTKPQDRMYEVLSAQFMPRHENDTVAYKNRYKQWCALPRLVGEVLNRREE